MQRITLPAVLVLLAAACTGDADARDASATPAVDSALRPGAPAPGARPAEPAAAAWRTNPAEGVTLTPGATTVVETGPHTLLWQEGAAELAPPYTVRAELRKRAGRLHEGFGVVFGATGLEGAEDAQAYSYFLVRGDGSFLIKRRQGAETPVVRDWTRHPRINRDAGGGGRGNVLEVTVGTDTTVFAVNGAEVARVPSSALAVRGRAGLRVAHEVVVEVAGFQAAPAADSVAP
jgi:hypothetical protein